MRIFIDYTIWGTISGKFSKRIHHHHFNNSYFCSVVIWNPGKYLPMVLHNQVAKLIPRIPNIQCSNGFHIRGLVPGTSYLSHDTMLALASGDLLEPWVRRSAVWKRDRRSSDENVGKHSFPFSVYPCLATWTARSDWWNRPRMLCRVSVFCMSDASAEKGKEKELSSRQRDSPSLE